MEIKLVAVTQRPRQSESRQRSKSFRGSTPPTEGADVDEVFTPTSPVMHHQHDDTDNLDGSRSLIRAGAARAEFSLSSLRCDFDVGHFEPGRAATPLRVPGEVGDGRPSNARSPLGITSGVDFRAAERSQPQGAGGVRIQMPNLVLGDNSNRQTCGMGVIGRFLRHTVHPPFSPPRTCAHSRKHARGDKSHNLVLIQLIILLNSAPSEKKNIEWNIRCITSGSKSDRSLGGTPRRAPRSQRIAEVARVTAGGGRRGPPPALT
ncbi:hypothetical protein EVAR_13602_1 [Eumeta japonica]|uniref:Uncharacterized protein n=1 Tax=Eumeta variegata TaxID=151549 RepID=A0A4C1UTQ4_EUMVA|nr:hypothetical protein EVAR_13602_1 [Eumeta japonica]